MIGQRKGLTPEQREEVALLVANAIRNDRIRRRAEVELVAEPKPRSLIADAASALVSGALWILRVR